MMNDAQKARLRMLISSCPRVGRRWGKTDPRGFERALAFVEAYAARARSSLDASPSLDELMTGNNHIAVGPEVIRIDKDGVNRGEAPRSPDGTQDAGPRLDESHLSNSGYAEPFVCHTPHVRGLREMAVAAPDSERRGFWAWLWR